jgi:hypothetical protein
VRRILTVVLPAVLLAGCGSAAKTGQAPAPTTLAGVLGFRLVSAQQEKPGPAATLQTQTTAPAPAPLPAPKVLCDAPDLAFLVGRPRTEIPVPADLSRRRVVCATCPGPDEVRPDRTDVLFNANTGIITAVKCG